MPALAWHSNDAGSVKSDRLLRLKPADFIDTNVCNPIEVTMLPDAEPDDGADDEQFLIQGGLDALVGYRAIRSRGLRQIIVRLIAATAEAELSGEIADPIRELVLMSNALKELRG